MEEVWVWTWGGNSFGYIDEDALYTHDGRHVGYVEPGADDILIFSIADGRYIGQLEDQDRLITKLARSNRHRRPRKARRQRTPRTPRRPRRSRRVRVGHTDFPLPEHL
jgi:hypothetical protein